MTKKTFALMARVSTENPRAIKLVLEELVPKGSITPTTDGFLVKAAMQGEAARELNRSLLSALRRVERKTRLRTEWKSSSTTERFFDYVPKGARPTSAAAGVSTRNVVSKPRQPTHRQDRLIGTIRDDISIP